MQRIEKTVFISYRRTNVPWALAVFQSLTNHGYDVFFDYSGIASGDFESIILGNIAARAHFLVLLTPSALERCGDAADWLRREIETALDTQRNIVPIMLEGFDFGSPTIASQLTGRLATLKHYNALSIPPEYFLEAMDRLRSRYLCIALDAVLHPASISARRAATEQQAAAEKAPAVQEHELTAQQWFERGLNVADLDEKLRFYSNAIHLRPDYANAFYNRGVARGAKGDLDGAVQDYTEAIRLKPDYVNAFYNRGIARGDKGDLDGAVEDYTEAIRLKPDYANAFHNRGNARKATGALDGAVEDYTEAIRLKPDHANAFYNRGIVRKDKGDLDGAVEDYTEVIRLKPDYAKAFYSRGTVRKDKGDLDGAVEDYTEAIRLSPDFANAFYNRALALKKQAHNLAAIADFQKYLDTGGGMRDGDTEHVERMIRDLSGK